MNKDVIIETERLIIKHGEVEDYEHKDLKECDFDKLKSDFRHYKGNYNYSYTLVNYILNNYSEEEITELYKNLNYLREIAERIFEEAKLG